MTASPILTSAASLLLAAGTITAGTIPAAGTASSFRYMDFSYLPPDSPDGEITVTSVEKGNRTEELEFDWVVVPSIDPQQASSIPESGRMPAKKIHRENGERTPSINWIMKLFASASTSGLNDLIEQILSEMAPDCHQVNEMAEHVQVGSTTKELEFDWVVQPFMDPDQTSSDSGSGKVLKKGMSKEGDDD